jgi:hypothetical protein
MFKATAIALTILIATSLSSGCTLTRGSSVLVGTKRAPIEASAVKLYLQPPTRYEQVAILSADARNAFASQQNLTDNTIERLKNEAAALGANGILLQGVESTQVGSSGIATVNTANPHAPIITGSSGVILGKEGKGIAIYVIEE